MFITIFYHIHSLPRLFKWFYVHEVFWERCERAGKRKSLLRTPGFQSEDGSGLKAARSYPKGFVLSYLKGSHVGVGEVEATSRNGVFQYRPALMFKMNNLLLLAVAECC